MKIAYILYPEVIVSNKSNGIRSQAECWARMMTDRGHNVTFVNNWEDYDWKIFDVIHLFSGHNTFLTTRLAEINSNICISPIVDPTPTSNAYSIFLKAKLGYASQGKIKTMAYRESIQLSHAKKILVRTIFEQRFIEKGYCVSQPKFAFVPLSYSMPPIEIIEGKENFCLHISSIYQPRKNAARLIQAAVKYGFELYLAGNKGAEQQFAPLAELIEGHDNIHVLGFISEEEKINLYKKAKVFALPSLWEGVGIVALDAALYGCEIVITNIEGPKEYYKGQCFEVNPYDIDEIGKAVMAAMNGKKSYQPQLAQYIQSSYSPDIIGEKLEHVYKSMI